MQFDSLKFKKFFVLVFGLLLISCGNSGRSYDCLCDENWEAYLFGRDMGNNVLSSDSISSLDEAIQSLGFLDSKQKQFRQECVTQGYESLLAGIPLPNEKEREEKCQKNVFDVLSEGGLAGQIIIFILFILSMITIYLFFERLFTIKKALKQDQHFFNTIKDFIHDEKYDSAIDLCKKTDTPIARMLEKGILRINKSLKDISTTINNVGKLELSKLENNLAILGTIAGAAPMIGFLGTAIGMVIAFFKLTEFGDGAIDIKLLSEGIYLAMTTTVAGLIVGILAYISYNYLVARITKAVYQMESITIEFLDLIYDKKHN